MENLSKCSFGTLAHFSYVKHMTINCIRLFICVIAIICTCMHVSNMKDCGKSSLCTVKVVHPDQIFLLFSDSSLAPDHFHEAVSYWMKIKSSLIKMILSRMNAAFPQREEHCVLLYVCTC